MFPNQNSLTLIASRSTGGDYLSERKLAGKAEGLFGQAHDNYHYNYLLDVTVKTRYTFV